MRIITCNTNGIRSAESKGFFDWLAEKDADIVCIQETKAQEAQLSKPAFHPEGYHCFYSDAEKKGYSGTALYSRKKPLSVIKEVGLRLFVQKGGWWREGLEILFAISFFLLHGLFGDGGRML